MKLRILVCFLLLLPDQVIAGRIDNWSYVSHTRIKWHDYGTTAFKQAEKLKRPVFVLVFADWCGWCRKFELNVIEQPEVRTILETKFVPVLVDYTRRSDLAKQLGIKSVPTSMILTHQGRIMLRFYGYIGKQDFIEVVNNTLSKWQRGELPEDKFGVDTSCCPVDLK